MDRDRVNGIVDSVAGNVASAAVLYLLAVLGDLISAKPILVATALFALASLTQVALRKEAQQAGPKTWRTAVFFAAVVVEAVTFLVLIRTF